MTDPLLQEVHDDLRRERLQKLWRKTRLPLAGIVIAVIAIVAGNSIYAHYEEQRSGEATAALHAAMVHISDKEFDQAAKNFAAIRDTAPDKLADMATLWEARTYAATSNHEKAATTLWMLATRPQSSDLRLRDLACVQLYAFDKDVPDACNGNTTSPLQRSLRVLHAVHVWNKGDVATAHQALVAAKTAYDFNPAELTQINGWISTLANLKARHES